MSSREKSPLAAFTLSFFLPGAGLWYLGKWRAGFLNLAIVLAIGVIAMLLMSPSAFDSYFRYLAVGCGSASAAHAKRLADEMNEN